MSSQGITRDTRVRVGVVGTLLASAALIAGAVFPGILGTKAVDDTGQFLLNGLIENSAATPPYDWSNLFDASGNQIVTPDPVNGPLLADKFLNDVPTPDTTYFTSNKDIQNVSAWGCTTINNPTPKDDLMNAYAALFQIPSGAPENAGDTVIYLGSERGSNNGDSFAGFWLFKNKNVACNQATGTFSGTHTVGDLLVVSNYTNGGGTQAVCVFSWTGVSASTTDCGGGTVTAPMTLVLTGGVCPTPATGTPPDNACAIANTTTISSPWVPTSHLSNEFVEAGVDLTQLFKIEGGGSCFSTFLAETRSSQQVTATLKDFAGGQLSTCLQPPIVTTATPGGSTLLPGSAQHDVATISGAPGRPAPTGTITFTLCGPSQVTSAGCPSGGTQVGTPVTISGGGATSIDVTGLTTPNDLLPGKYCWRADYTPDSAGSNFYNPSTHTNATTECFTIIKATPNIATAIQVTGNGGLVNTSYGDTATLTNFVGTVTGETITFSLFGPYTGTPTCSTSDPNEPVFTTTGTLNSSGVATTSSTFTPTAPGNYVWVASYGGNALNNGASEPCNGNNESGTITPPSIHITKTADAATVSAGTDIGFTVTVSNTGAGTATGVTLTDALPGGNSATPVHWTIDPSTGNPGSFSITGNDGSQQLTLAGQPITMSNGASLTVHVIAATTSTSCATYSNTASVTTSNDGHDSANASEQVLCAAIHVTKTADAASVSAGTPIGFTVTVSNIGAGTALGVNLTDALPGGNSATPVHWSIDTSTGNPGSFSITGADGSQQLTLAGQPISMPSGASLTVHVTAPTNGNNCTVYNNSAGATTTNDGHDSANASETVLCPSIVVTKTSDAASVSAGTPIGFTVTVANNGPGTATGVTLNDALPGGNGATPVTWSIDTSTGNPGSFGITGSAGSQHLVLAGQPITMPSGASLTVHVTAPTNSNSCTTYNNTAMVTITNGNGGQSSASETVLCASIHVNKTADAASVSAGTPIGFTVTVSNTGAGVATGVTLTDALPGGNGAAPVHWTIDSGTGNPGSFSITGNDGSQQLTLAGQPITMGAGSSLTVHVVAATSSTSCTTYHNTASVATSNDGSDQHSASEQVLCPSIHVNKTADAASVSAGTSIGFTVTVSNTGAGNATGVTLTDALPGGNSATPVHWTIDGSTGNPGSFSITGADGSQQLMLAGQPISLASGASLVVHVVAATSRTSCTTYDNTASASATNDGSDQHSASEQVLCPVIAVNKTADAASVSAGTAIGFTVTVSNTGAGNATGVTLTDALPGGNSANPVHWTIDATTGNPSAFSITGNDGSQQLTLAGQPISLAAGASLVVHVVAATTFTSCTTYDNTASASASNDGSDQHSASEQVLCPSLAITKTAHATPVSVGTPIGFDVVVSNGGPGTATNVMVGDPLPAGTGILWAILPAYAGQGTCSITGLVGSQVLGCSLGDLLPGHSITVSIVSATTAGSAGTYPNTATATAGNAPPVSASAAVVVLAPGLNVLKTADSAAVPSGSPIGFTITAINAGPGTATGATINDPLPSGSGVSWSISPAYSGPGTCSITSSSSGQTLSCALGDLAANTSASVHVTSATTTASCATYPNTATASATNQASVTASATTAVICAGVLGITAPNTGAGVPWREGLMLMAGGLAFLAGAAGLRRRRRTAEE